MTPSGGIRERLSSVSDIQIQNAPYYSRSVTGRMDYTMCIFFYGIAKRFVISICVEMKNVIGKV